MADVPVLVLSGYLGAGKTTLLNRLLREDGARLGVIVNDYGVTNIDAGLVIGQIDEPVSIGGGCICCIGDADQLDVALEALARPDRLLDAILIEASGIADPVVLRQLVRFTGASGVRPGGVIEVVDAPRYFETVDTGTLAPMRFAAADLVLLNKVDELPAPAQALHLAPIERRVRERNPTARIVNTVRCDVPERLVFDVRGTGADPDVLPISELYASTSAASEEHHPHASAHEFHSEGPIDPVALMELLEDPPAGVYRVKGHATVQVGRRARRYTVHLVGRSIHIRSDGGGRTDTSIVAISPDAEHEGDVDARLQRLSRTSTPQSRMRALRTLQRYRRLSA